MWDRSHVCDMYFSSVRKRLRFPGNDEFSIDFPEEKEAERGPQKGQHQFLFCIHTSFFNDAAAQHIRPTLQKLIKSFKLRKRKKSTFLKEIYFLGHFTCFCLLVLTDAQEKQIEIATPGKRASHRLGYSSHPEHLLSGWEPTSPSSVSWRLPIQILTGLYIAELRWLDGNWCIQCGEPLAIS